MVVSRGRAVPQVRVMALQRHKGVAEGLKRGRPTSPKNVEAARPTQEGAAYRKRDSLAVYTGGVLR